MKQIQEGHGSCGEVFGAFLRGVLQDGKCYPPAPINKIRKGTTTYRLVNPVYGPAAIYEMHEEFCETMERQAKRGG